MFPKSSYGRFIKFIKCQDAGQLVVSYMFPNEATRVNVPPLDVILMS